MGCGASSSAEAFATPGAAPTDGSREEAPGADTKARSEQSVASSTPPLGLRLRAVYDEDGLDNDGDARPGELVYAQGDIVVVTKRGASGEEGWSGYLEHNPGAGTGRFLRRYMEVVEDLSGQEDPVDSKEESRNEMIVWLRRLKLEQYSGAFEEAGIVEIAQVRALSVEELKSRFEMKPGHLKKLLHKGRMRDTTSHRKRSPSETEFAELMSGVDLFGTSADADNTADAADSSTATLTSSMSSGRRQLQLTIEPAAVETEPKSKSSVESGGSVRDMLLLHQENVARRRVQIGGDDGEEECDVRLFSPTPFSPMRKLSRDKL